MSKERDFKVYIKVDESLQEIMASYSVNLDILLEDVNAEIKKEEVIFDNEPATRGIITYLVLRTAEIVIKKTAIKLGEMVVDKVTDTVIERVLKPVLDFIKGKEVDKNIVVNVILIQEEGENSFRTLKLEKLNDEQINSLNQILVKISAK